MITKTVPLKILTICPACKKRATFTWVGHQEVPEGMIPLELYRCSECRSTRSHLSLFEIVCKKRQV